MNKRILFNPTSVPALRSPRAPRLQTRSFCHAGNLGRVGLKGLKYDGSVAKLKGVRRESTQIGENESGHITAGTNEGILFLDSESLILYSVIESQQPADAFPQRHLPNKAWMASSDTMVRKNGFRSPRCPLSVQ